MNAMIRNAAVPLEKPIIIYNKKCFWLSRITDIFVALHKSQAERDGIEAWNVSSSHII